MTAVERDEGIGEDTSIAPEPKAYRRSSVDSNGLAGTVNRALVAAMNKAVEMGVLPKHCKVDDADVVAFFRDFEGNS